MSARHNLVTEFYQDLVEFGLIRSDVLAQIAVVLVALVVGWIVNRAVKRSAARRSFVVRGRLGREGFSRVLFPLAALSLVYAGSGILQNWFTHHLNLINLAEVLLTAMVNIRLLVYLLRRVFSTAWDERLEKPIAALIWLTYALHVLGVLPELWQFLDEIRLPLVKGGISLLNVLQGLVSVAITLLTALWLGSLIESRLMASDVMDVSLRVMTVKVSRALLIVLAVLVALPLVGIDLTVLSVFGGALGVGLGFGLQKIASNYVSGFIILMDRSVKIGDLVQIDGRQGAVTQLTSRYIVLKGGDGNEALIPNETLITSTVVNQSYTDRLQRIALPVHVSYEADLELALEIMLATAHSEPRVLEQPAPSAFVKSFGESAVNLELSVWIKDPENGAMPVQSSINIKIWREFRQQGIHIPVPQREVRINPPGSTPLV